MSAATSLFIITLSWYTFNGEFFILLFGSVEIEQKLHWTASICIHLWMPDRTKNVVNSNDITKKKFNKKLCAMHAIACCCQFWCVFLCCHSFSDFSRRYMRGNGIINASSRYKQYLRLQPKIPTLHETGFTFPSFEHYFENFRTFSKGLKFWFFQALATFTGYAGYPALNCLWKWLKICKIVLIRLVL